MIAALLLSLLAAPAAAPADSTPAARCLPGQDGFITMRLRGSIEEDVHWTEPALDCSGMPRPDGKGLRLRFAGRRADGGELAILFAAPELGMGASSRGVPVNVTVLDGAGARIYGTQGDSRCQFDEVEQREIADPAYPPGSYRVSASGFCVAPARAVDGEGSVLLTRFDFAGRVNSGEGDGDSPPGDLFPHLSQTGIEINTATGKHRFRAWIAADDRSRARGLKFVRSLPPDQGMLFLFDQEQPVSFWMQDTYLPLDLLFIRADGTVVTVRHRATPLREDPIDSELPVKAVLELSGGTASRIALESGDRVISPALSSLRP